MIRISILEKKCGVYQIKSNINGKLYIGSSVNLKRRWKEHFSSLANNKHYNSHLQNHYNKYGKADLIFTVLIICKKEKVIQAEQYYIDLLFPKFNIILTAGDNTCRDITKTTREKISKALMGHKISKETKIKISKALKGKPSNIKGYKHTKEARAKISLNNVGNKNSLGIVTSKEKRQKIKEGNIAYWNSPEGKERAKQRQLKWWNSPAGLEKKERMKHNFLSIESKQKISETLKKRKLNGLH